MDTAIMRMVGDVADCVAWQQSRCSSYAVFSGSPQKSFITSIRPVETVS